MEYIIQTTLGFLTISGSFSAEYPDAEIFPNRQKALRTLKKNPITFHPKTVALVKDYGMDTEESESV